MRQKGADIQTEERNDTLQWYAVRTFFRREKYVRDRLQDKGIEAWLPLQEKIRRYTRKVRKVQLPLISQYIFVKIDEDERARVLEVEGVIQFVRPSGYVVPIPQSEIDLLRRVIGEDVSTEVEEGTITEGDEVEIIAGELTGLKGQMVEERGKNRIAVNLTNMGLALWMEVPISAVRKL